jgi:putative PIN family toxin of toxin-antitoxin system
VITVDANIYVSAVQFGGNPERLLHRAIAGDIEIAISEPILAEVLRILQVKFGRSEVDLAKLEATIRGLAKMVTPTQPLSVVKDDPDDNRIIECAVASDSQCIVTGDKDLLRMGEYAGIKMVKVGDFLQRGLER